jgi:hypothetical protein
MARIGDHSRGIKSRDACWHKKYWVQSLIDKGLMFEWSILTQLPTSEFLGDAERYWISYFKSIGCPLTNLTAGGEGGTLGIPCSTETKKKIGQANSGKRPTPEHRAKLSAALKGRTPSWAGSPLTEARKAHLDALHAIPPFQDQHGRIYHSLKEAADVHKLSRGNICMVLKRKRKSTGGLIFTYLDPPAI